MLWLVCVEKVPQASEHLCPAKLQTRCDISCACQSICPFIPTDSSMPRTVDPLKSLYNLFIYNQSPLHQVASLLLACTLFSAVYCAPQHGQSFEDIYFAFQVLKTFILLFRNGTWESSRKGSGFAGWTTGSLCLTGMLGMTRHRTTTYCTRTGIKCSSLAAAMSLALTSRWEFVFRMWLVLWGFPKLSSSGFLSFVGEMFQDQGHSQELGTSLCTKFYNGFQMED